MGQIQAFKRCLVAILNKKLAERRKMVDYEILYELYIVQNKPMHEIAKELKIAVGSVYNYLHKYKIQTRPQYKGFKGKKHSQETKGRISERTKGRIFSEETKSKMSESHKKGGIGHKKLRADGYVAIYFPDHPKSSSDGYIMEHDLIMECIIGRRLEDFEVVHHKNRIRNDNRKENLELLTFKEHASLHMKERQAKKKGGMTYQ